MKDLTLDEMRNCLIRQEETLIFAFIERAQFRQNKIIYEPGAIPLPQENCSFLDFFLHQVEVVYARTRRYTTKEIPFSSNLPDPVLELIQWEPAIVPNDINKNAKIKELYINEIVPRLCACGDCQNYGSSATCDVTCLQALSTRIHYGKYIAEAKFKQETELYRDLIRMRDADGIFNELVDKDIEERLLVRVRRKAATYGQDPEDSHPAYKVEPEVIREIYQSFIIPLTCEVEVEYLLGRLDADAAKADNSQAI